MGTPLHRPGGLYAPRGLTSAQAARAEPFQMQGQRQAQSCSGAGPCTSKPQTMIRMQLTPSAWRSQWSSEPHRHEVGEGPGCSAGAPREVDLPAANAPGRVPDQLHGRPAAADPANSQGDQAVAQLQIAACAGSSPPMECSRQNMTPATADQGTLGGGRLASRGLKPGGHVAVLSQNANPH